MAIFFDARPHPDVPYSADRPTRTRGFVLAGRTNARSTRRGREEHRGDDV